jgi:hypothetical protein
MPWEGFPTIERWRSGRVNIDPEASRIGKSGRNDLMRRKSAFQPSLVDALESRQLLSHAGLKGHAVIRPAAQHAPKAPAVTPVVAINAAFDSFVQDYSQTRAIYLSSIVGSSAPTAMTPNPNTTAFTNYTSYRVDLLGQQLTSILVKSYLNATTSSHPNRGLFNSFNSLVQTRVNGVQNGTVMGSTVPGFKPRTLGAALTMTIPPAGSSDAAAALDSLAQDQAIGSARIAVINGFNFTKTTASSKHK